MKTATLIKATVKYKAGQPRMTSTGNMRINIVASLENGEEVKLWGNPDDAIAYLDKGEVIALTQDSRGNYTLIATQDRPNDNGHQQSLAEAPAPTATTVENDDLEEMAEIVQFFLARFPVLPHSEIVNLSQSVFKYRKGGR